MNGKAIQTQLSGDINTQLYLALDEAVESLKKLRDRVLPLVSRMDEDAMDAVILKKAMEEDDGTGWKTWQQVKKELSREGLL